MSSEDLMRNSDDRLVKLHVANVKAIEDSTADRTLLEETRLLAAVALTARRMHGTLGAGDRMRAHVRANALAIEASVAKTRAAHPPANENAADANLEMEMDDDSGRTPERVAALDADLKRRLAALAERREAKGLVRDHALVRRGAPGEERARDLGPSSDAAD